MANGSHLRTSIYGGEATPKGRERAGVPYLYENFEALASGQQ